MKKIILIGGIGCGKTTLCQRLNGMELQYKKTQALEVVRETIDTPGEYLEHRSFLQALMVTSVEADLAVFMLDPTQERYMYSPGQAAAFPIPVAGVISKADLAEESHLARSRELLQLAGADPIFELSAVDGRGMEEFVHFLEE